MIWFTLALFAVSFLAVALLAPKPNIENARREELDPESFPRATEDAPIPLVLGTVVVRGPNTIWYGDFKSENITERVRVSLFRSRRVTVGYKYYLGMNLALCLGIVTLRRVIWDGKAVFSGNVGDGGIGDISQGGANNFNISDNVIGGGTRSTYTIESLGIPSSAIDAGLVSFRHGFTVTHVGGTTFGLTAQVWGEFRNASLGVISSFSENGNNGNPSKTSTVLETGTIPPGTRRIDIVGNIVFAGFGGSLQVTGKIFEAIGPLPTSSQSFSISAPELFGGHKRGGGVQGDVDFYPGTFTQGVNSYLQSQIGANEVPAYRGTCHVVFKNFYIGESPSLRAIEFEVESTTNSLTISNPMIAEDMNCAEAIYEILTNRWRGLGIPTSKIDLASFQAAATTLSNESNGCSVIVSSSNDAKKVIVEILRQVDGVLRENSQGRIQILLIRADYVASTLPIYDEDDILEVSSFTKTLWEDVVSEVKVSFSAREKNDTRVALAQNQAIINMLGRRKTTEISFPFCYNPTLANKLAARELSVLSIPLFRMKVIMNRNGYTLRTGSVIKISWPEYDLSEIIMRVQKVDLGMIDDNKITLELVQDVFSVNIPVFLPPESSSWVDPVALPADVTSVVAEMPYFYSSVLENPIPDGFGSIIVFTIKPQAQSINFTTFKGETVNDTNNSDVNNVDYMFTGLITAPISEVGGFANGVLDSFTVDGFVGQTPVDVTIAQVREGELGIIYMNGEWMAYENFTDNENGTYTFSTVYRGLFGTRPLAHADNTRMFIFSTSLLESGSLGSEVPDDSSIFYKVSDSTAFGTRDPSSVTATSFALQGLANRPLRPRNLQMDGSRVLPFQTTGIHSLTWVPSNRAESEVVFEQDSAGTPDLTEEYDVEVWIDGVEDLSMRQSDVSSPLSLDFSGKAGATGEVRLYSRRASVGGASSFYYSFFPFVLPASSADSTTVTADNTSTTADQQ